MSEKKPYERPGCRKLFKADEVPKTKPNFFPCPVETYVADAMKVVLKNFNESREKGEPAEKRMQDVFEQLRHIAMSGKKRGFTEATTFLEAWHQMHLIHVYPEETRAWLKAMSNPSKEDFDFIASLTRIVGQVNAPAPKKEDDSSSSSDATITMSSKHI